MSSLVERGARERIAARNRARGTRLVVLDDDPTGTQTVSGVPVVLEPGDDDLRWALAHPSGVAFVLTNSRSLPEAEAIAVAEDLGRRLARLGGDADLRCISRSDSTLRGHFPAETDALARGLGGIDGVLLCPAFLEAGRITAGDIQWVRQGDEYVPAARTEFARDRTFGYRSEDLPGWVRERAGDREVRSVTLDDIRGGGPEAVADRLCAAPDGAVIIGNAAAAADLEVLVLGLLDAERRGRRLLCRTGPSFVGVRGGLVPQPPLRRVGGGGRGLVVVGSHTALTGEQLGRALDRHRLDVVELRVQDVLSERGDDHVREVARRVAGAPRDVALVTSRELRAGRDGAESLALSARVSRALVRAVALAVAERAPAWVLAKGGITSHDVARHGLGARRAVVAGQLFDGMVSVWLLGERLPYVVFPGNVGGPDHLSLALDKLVSKEN
jgi:uncharacterized protein YgbK (DUF1537 family)